MPEESKPEKLYNLAPITAQMLTEDRYKDAWSPMWVRLNTIATVLAAFTSLVALVVAVIALTS